MAKNTAATGVYIGKLVYPRREIEDKDDDKAHLNEEEPKVIEYVNATEDHKFMLNRVLATD